NPANQKRVDVSNIPNDKSPIYFFSLLNQAASYLEADQGLKALRLLGRIPAHSLPPLPKAEYFELKGQALAFVGNFFRSRLAYIKAHRIYSRLRDRYGQIATLKKWGDCERQVEDFRSAYRR